MPSHFAIVREAIWMSPSTSLFCAHLCATTCATPPAPMMRMVFFMSARSLLSVSGVACEASRKARLEVRIGEFADRPDRAVRLADRDRRHLDAVEPVLLDHGVTGRILDRDAVAGLERLGEAEGAEHVS